ncbi:ribonuclease G [Enterococcus faecalis]|nr:ribonuclease G [Enterococcus faecalis]
MKKWNWGAFSLNILWGIGNKTYLPLLCLIPFFNLVWIFVCGIKGNEWAWKDGEYTDVETFKKVQKTWNRAGITLFIIQIAIIILYFVLFATFFSILFNNMNTYNNY